MVAPSETWREYIPLVKEYLESCRQTDSQPRLNRFCIFVGRNVKWLDRKECREGRKKQIRDYVVAEFAKFRQKNLVKNQRGYIIPDTLLSKELNHYLWAECRHKWKAPSRKEFALRCGLAARYFYLDRHPVSQREKIRAQQIEFLEKAFSDWHYAIAKEANQVALNLRKSLGVNPSMSACVEVLGAQLPQLYMGWPMVASAISYGRVGRVWDGQKDLLPVYGKKTVTPEAKPKPKSCPRCRAVGPVYALGPRESWLCLDCVREWREVVRKDEGVLAG